MNINIYMKVLFHHTNSHLLVKHQYDNHQLNNSTAYVENPSDDYTYKKEDDNKTEQRKSVHFNSDIYEKAYNNLYTQQGDSNNINEMEYYMADTKTNNNKKKKKKNKHIYAYKQNELYYKSLLNMEHSYIEEENYNNNESTFFLSNINERFMTKPSESVIEVLRRKNFLLDDPNNTKTINMSREAFSWFLKDLRSRIISLVLEYLLIIDNGYVTNIAKDVYTKYQKKKNNAINNMNNNSSSGINNNINFDENIKSNHCEESKKSYDNNNNNNNNNNNSSSSSSCAYITRTNKDPKKSEIYVKETLLLILSLSQCDISHPIFLENLTKAQKEFIDFGSHIGLFLKPNDSYIFITPYALLLTINNFNSQYYLSLLSNITIEGLCEEDVRKRLSKRYFHFYLLKQDEKEETYMNKDLSSDIKNKDEKSLILDKRKNITKKLINDSLYSDIKMNGSNNLEIGLIVQSNFKVYLYTSSLLKINILSHLCELQARTPNMVVGILTRRSVLNAYNSDITANQIIKFLESYSHPGKNNFKSSIPMNVITQLKLWESERHRLTLEDAIVFKSFEKDFMPHLYQQIVIWANSKNYLLYYTPWPKNNTKEFDLWIKAEKYLCCIYESKNEIIDKIKEIREKLMKKRQSG
ncbi:hypothetical protein PFFVO_03725 [Plasmodium falciparum Vietnam Oak-Knoll (FVO)]|uniref:General transcription factor IIH subunit 4 n=1 Tax=Plasmodium falciparum Vietnam Oak-Knoll (FVO) TaxID=1036723 RepID=A0A024V3H6_PLAFA|nr:hypothetical protein PFFVO_03725 [Plasmodium falciparum Vietnam Oak-Knoll (FVO)]